MTKIFMACCYCWPRKVNLNKIVIKKCQGWPSRASLMIHACLRNKCVQKITGINETWSGKSESHACAWILKRVNNTMMRYNSSYTKTQQAFRA